MPGKGHFSSGVIIKYRYNDTDKRKTNGENKSLVYHSLQLQIAIKSAKTTIYCSKSEVYLGHNTCFDSDHWYRVDWLNKQKSLPNAIFYTTLDWLTVNYKAINIR